MEELIVSISVWWKLFGGAQRGYSRVAYLISAGSGRLSIRNRSERRSDEQDITKLREVGWDCRPRK
jgi:hypothetical protein